MGRGSIETSRRAVKPASSLPPARYAPYGDRWHLAGDTSRNTQQGLFSDDAETRLDNSQAYHLALLSSAILLVRGWVTRIALQNWQNSESRTAV